ncbi:hypothetical protein MtrunA17_Chr1g0202881 [Medicago truncatula]|uniref:Uncharacterized protein n=1 Tax=Medicago truncatula TaxID=3880 RepID=A0A396JWU7_MEDTR|nr:hypothetical protein MtrunA17_Chr1g0202881 [Medicago truncatula]
MALKRENPKFFNLVCQLPFYPFGGKHWPVHTAQEWTVHTAELTNCSKASSFLLSVTT